MFDYNDYVKVIDNAPKEFPKDNIGIICFVNQAEQDFILRELLIQKDEYYYSVEFEDGNIIEIPEIYLEKVSNEK